VKWSSPWPATEQNVRRFVNKGSGVYIIRSATGKKPMTMGDLMQAVIYVRQPESLEARMLEHFAASEENKGLRDHLRLRLRYDVGPCLHIR
jgi:hypothetical protein